MLRSFERPQNALFDLVSGPFGHTQWEYGNLPVDHAKQAPVSLWIIRPCLCSLVASLTPSSPRSSDLAPNSLSDYKTQSCRGCSIVSRLAIPEGAWETHVLKESAQPPSSAVGQSQGTQRTRIPGAGQVTAL